MWLVLFSFLINLCWVTCSPKISRWYLEYISLDSGVLIFLQRETRSSWWSSFRGQKKKRVNYLKGVKEPEKQTKLKSAMYISYKGKEMSVFSSCWNLNRSLEESNSNLPETNYAFESEMLWVPETVTFSGIWINNVQK